MFLIHILGDSFSLRRLLFRRTRVGKIIFLHRFPITRVYDIPSSNTIRSPAIEHIKLEKFYKNIHVVRRRYVFPDVCTPLSYVLYINTRARWCEMTIAGRPYIWVTSCAANEFFFSKLRNLSSKLRQHRVSMLARTRVIQSFISRQRPNGDF